MAWYRVRKNVVLAFYPGDWTPVCSQQILSYQKDIDRFERLNCQLLGISVDSIPCHKAWASLNGLSYPLMSDYFPHGAVASRYGLLSEKGYAERAVFAVDLRGIIQYIDRVPLASLPDTERLFKALAELRA
jgi:peroxiredoxin